MRNSHLTMEECARRYRRLMRCLRWQGILNRSEASALLRDWRDGFRFGGEAVTHYGGSTRLLGDAIRNRRIGLRYCTND